MQFKECIPWRVRHKLDVWAEEKLRPRQPSLYKLAKFGRTNINTPRYWDDTWSSDEVDREYSELFVQVGKHLQGGEKVLDVGCGIGNLSRYLKETCGSDLTCLDFSRWALDELKKEGFPTIFSKLPKIPLPDDSFDAAVATEVLEHLSRPEATIKQMKRVVRPGGKVIFSVPNDMLHPHEELEHQNSFSKDSLSAILAQEFKAFSVSEGVLTGDVRFLLAVAVVDGPEPA
jgi:cyclopropane fatty-acyl-phospholipid synthase-like methyltransferase